MARQKQTPPRSLESYYAEPTKEITLNHIYQLKNICIDILDELATKNNKNSLGAIGSYLDSIRLINFPFEYSIGTYWTVLYGFARCRKIALRIRFAESCFSDDIEENGLAEIQYCIESVLDSIIDLIHELERNEYEY